MHQQVDTENAAPLSQKDTLLKQKYQLVHQYRAAVKWSFTALEYKRRFEREEDYGVDDMKAHVEFLKDDARRELISVSRNIKLIRAKINEIDDGLMNLSKGSTK